ncbi:MAG: PDZ domain-containing protein, partial [Gammaproteobacteria bacterium]|nr:PDZ domain-containing protein [Gammaproteobacteria bacterium]
NAGLMGIREDARGNIHFGDIIIAINGEPVINEDSLLGMLENFEPGDSIEITTLRDEKIHTYNLRLAAPD